MYKANVLLYDRETESLWSQLARESVTGPMTGTKLKVIPSTLTTWKRWKRSYPSTLVLSKETGYARNYDIDPYESYHRSPLSFLGFGKKIPHLPEKELIVGITINGVNKAYPFSALRQTEGTLTDNISGKEVTIHFDKDSEEAYANDSSGKGIPSFISYWFVWYDFHPDSKVYGK